MAEPGATAEPALPGRWWRPLEGEAPKALRGGASFIGVDLLPVAGDVDAAAYPHAIVPLDVVQEALQRRDAAGAAQKAAVHADAHHLRCLLALGIERIE